ncbi:MAG: hypothetical protein AAB296_10485, partial [Candidatus Desantisbacteria bacterium]
TGGTSYEVVNRQYIILPKLTDVSPIRGTVGTIVTIWMDGFAANENIRVEFGRNASITYATTNNMGTLGTTFIVNTQPCGTTSITTNGITSAGNVFVIDPQITEFTPVSGTVGSMVSIAGDGYGMSEKVKIKFGNTAIIKTATASSEGSFSTTFIVDTQKFGTTTVAAIGSSSARVVERIYQIQPNIISILPNTGSVGTRVTVKGNGFGASKGMWVEFGTTASIIIATSANNGSFTAVFTVDTQVYGTTTITGYDGTTSAAGTFTILTNFWTYTPKSGVVGTPVVVNGNGFGANENIRVTFGNNTTITTATTDDRGLFTSGFTVDLQVYGTKTVKAVGLTSNREFEDVFNVTSVITSMSPTIGSVTTQITISGNGFGANEGLRIAYGNNTAIGETTTDNNGSFSTTFIIDTQTYGTRSVIATGLTSGRADSRLLKLVARMWQVSPNTGTVGTKITVWGDGYTDDETIQVYFKNILASDTGLVTTNINGSYSASFVVTTQVAGTTTINAIGNGINKSNQTTENTYWITSQITSVTPASGPVGTKVTVKGTGYSNAESVRISFGTNQSITNVLTSGYGTFSTVFTVDTQAIGTTTITATGEITSDNDIFVIRTGIASIIPTSGTAGKEVTITGGGYMAGEGVNIKFGQNLLINTCTADGNGWIEGTFTVDEQGWGDKEVRATGEQSNSYGVITFRVLQHLVSVEPTEGTVGSCITVYGNGYTPGTMTINFGETLAITKGMANDNGTFSIPFTINTQPYGTTTVTARDFVSYQDTAVVVIKSHIVTVTPTIGSVGTRVTVSGDGYGISESIRILLGNNSTITTTTSSRLGSFSTNLIVDIQACGTVSLIAYGKQNEVSHVDDDRFRIRGEITLVTPQQGTVGTPITVGGNGYGTNEGINIGLGLNETIVGTTAAGNGVFAAVFTIDTQFYGTKTLTVTGVTTNDKDFRTVKVLPQVVSVLPVQGTIGTIITIYGTGYEPTITMQVDFGTVVGVGFGTPSGTTQIETSERGTFTGYVLTNVRQPYGTTTITAYRQENNVTAANTYLILPEVVSVQPTEGTVGTRVTVDGTGYRAGDTVKLQFGSVTVMATGSVAGNGSFTALFTVDTQMFGTTTIRGYSDNMAHDDSNIFKILTKIYQVSPVTGTVGSKVTIYGNGYGAGETVTVTFGKTTLDQVYTSQTDGQITAAWTVDTQVFGTRSIIGVGSSSQLPAQNSYFIIPDVCSVTPNQGTIGTDMTIVGSGFVENSVVNVNFGTRYAADTYKQVTASNGGTFSYTYQPEANFPQPAGTTTIRCWVTGMADNRMAATNTFFIKSRILTVSPAQATVGTTISIFGDGYSATYVVRIGFGDVATIATQATSDSGTFSQTFVVDTQRYGTTTITAQCSVNTADNTVVILPNIIKVAPLSGTVGSLVTVSGNGYSSSGQVRLEFGSTGTITTTTTASNGSWTAMFTVDTQGYGTTTITGYDISSGTNAGTYTYRILPNIINVTPRSGTVGSSVLVSGNGYTNDGQVRLVFGDNTSIATTSAASNGSFTISFVIDTQMYGTTTITGIGASNEAAGTYTYRVLPNIITVEPAAGTVGASVTVSGNGYGSEKAIRVRFGNNATISWTTSASNGSFTSIFVIDTQSYGTKTETGYDASNNIEAATFTYCITPNIISITPAEGSVGTRVTMCGNGFGGSHTIRIAFGLTPTIVNSTSANNGSFTAVFTVDTQMFGTTNVTANNGTPQGTAGTVFNIRANVYTVTPSIGTVGTNVTVRGNGYGANEILSIWFGVTQKPAASAESNGSWTTIFTVDQQPYATTTIYTRGTNISGEQVDRQFFILPKLTDVSPVRGTVGTIVTIWMDGFAANENIRVEFGRN